MSRKSLPKSNDKEFWLDGDTELVNRIKPNKVETHKLVWKGSHAVCISCPYEHTVPLDFKKYDLVDGKPVLKTDKRK